MPRTTRSSLFPLIIIHVRRYGESSRGPYHPRGRACDRVCVSDCLGRRGAPSWAYMQEDRKTGRTARHTEQDRQLPTLPTPPTLPTSHARLPRQPAMPDYPACPTPPHPVSSLSRVCHIVNRSATRAPRKTAFCQAILLFLDLSKRYALIHNNLRYN